MTTIAADSCSTLVVGATGLLGFEICRRLRACDKAVRAFVRDGSAKEALLRTLGCEIVRGDLRNRASLDDACRGVSTVVATANAIQPRRRGDSLKTVDRDGYHSLLAAAKATSVQRFVYVSVARGLPANNPLVRCKREIEQAVRRNGLTWTIVQPTAFMEIHLGPALGWDFVEGRARILGSGRARMDYVSVNDVAQVVAHSVDNPAAERRELQVAGFERLTPFGALAIAERATGRRFKVRRIPAPLLRGLSWLLRPIAPIPSSLLAMAVAMEAARDHHDTAQLFREFRVEPTAFAAYVHTQIDRRAVEPA